MYSLTGTRTIYLKQNKYLENGLLLSLPDLVNQDERTWAIEAGSIIEDLAEQAETGTSLRYWGKVTEGAL